jgi:hypothetical protein
MRDNTDEITKRFSLFSVAMNLEDEMRNIIVAPKTLADIPGSQPLDWAAFATSTEEGER